MKLRVSEAVKLMSKVTKKPMADMCRELNMGQPANLVLMVNKETLRATILAAMCEVCDYKMVLVPKNVNVEEGIEIKGEAKMCKGSVNKK